MTPLTDRLSALPAGARAELLRVLTSSSDVRADVIRHFFEREGARRKLAEVLMDLEEDHLGSARAGGGPRRARKGPARLHLSTWEARATRSPGPGRSG